MNGAWKAGDWAAAREQVTWRDPYLDMASVLGPAKDEILQVSGVSICKMPRASWWKRREEIITLSFHGFGTRQYAARAFRKIIGAKIDIAEAMRRLSPKVRV